MKVITVRNVPDEVYDAVTNLARRNRRSLQQQVLAILEQTQLLSGTSPVKRAAALRERLADRPMGDTVAEVREERRR
jgi:plasmid stability protein